MYIHFPVTSVKKGEEDVISLHGQTFHWCFWHCPMLHFIDHCLDDGLSLKFPVPSLLPEQCEKLKVIMCAKAYRKPHLTEVLEL